MDPLAPLTVFALQATLAGLVYGCLGAWFVHPWLARQRADVAMPLALLPFAFRFVGDANMVPGVVGPGYPMDAAWIVLVGDTACTVLALIAIGGYRFKWRAAPALALITLVESVGYGAYYVVKVDVEAVVENLHAHWYVGVLVVPLLTLTNVLVAALLWRGRAPAARSP